MKTPDSVGPRPSVEGLSKEQILINPFSGILSEEEFRAAVQEGTRLIPDIASELQNEARELSDVRGDHYGAIGARERYEDFIRSANEAKLTEDFSDTILVEDPVANTSQGRKSDELLNAFSGVSFDSSEYPEVLHPDDQYFIYANDSSGHILTEKFAGKKNLFLRNKLAGDNEKYLIALDTLVFVPDNKLRSIPDPERRLPPVKPESKYLAKPKNKEEMTKMLEDISGKIIEIVTGISINYKVLKDSHIDETALVKKSIKIKILSDKEIGDFVEKYFEQAKNIAGGVDYTSYGAEITEDGQAVEYEEIIVPVKEIKKLWARVQVIKRAAHLYIMSQKSL